MDVYLKQCRHYLISATVFSLFINALLLTVPLFMLQIFDRVLVSRSEETLLVLAIAASGALLVHLGLEICRARVLLAAGIKLDALVGPQVLSGLLEESVRSSDRDGAVGIRDLATLRGFLTGGCIGSMLDAPWVPIYAGLIWLLEPRLGTIAVGGALVLFGLAYLNEKINRKPLAALRQCARDASDYIDSGLRNGEVLYVLGMLNALRRRWEELHVAVMAKTAQTGCSSSTI